MKDRKYYLDFLKVISSFGVVLIHVISEYWYFLPVNSSDFKILSVIDSFVRFCVPIYFMVSGALFLNENKKINMKDFFVKKVLKLFLIYLLWVVLYKVVYYVFILNGSISITYLINAFKDTLLGEGIFHLRFLSVLFGFYLCVPVLRLITKKENKKVIEYLLLLLFIFTSVSAFSQSLFNISLKYSFVFGGNLLFFILGYYLNTYKISKKALYSVYALGAISLLCTIICTISYSINIGYSNELFYTYLSPNIVIYSASIFLLAKSIYEKGRNNKLLTFLTNSYFGVYLLHGFVLGVCIKIGLFNLNIKLWILVILLSIIIFCVSLIISYIISKIPFLKNLIKI